MAKYRILWFDDDFQDSITSPNEKELDVNLRRAALYSDAELAADYDLEVNAVKDLEQFRNCLTSFSRYDAVIFDLRGLDCNDSDNVIVMGDAKELADSVPNLLQYVYSANIHDPRFDITLRKLKEEGRCFNKALGSEKLFEKIKTDLDEALHYYKGHEECLSLIHDGYINVENRGRLNQILKNNQEKTLEYSPYNDMRQILEDLLKTLDAYGDLPLPEGTHKSVNRWVKFITEEYERKSDSHKPDYDRPLFPLEKCRQEIKYVLKYLCDMTNNYSHFLKKHPNYLRKDENVLEYDALIQQSVYPAFFVVMKWYYGYMSKYHTIEN